MWCRTRIATREKHLRVGARKRLNYFSFFRRDQISSVSSFFLFSSPPFSPSSSSFIFFCLFSFVKNGGIRSQEESKKSVCLSVRMSERIIICISQKRRIRDEHRCCIDERERAREKESYIFPYHSFTLCGLKTLHWSCSWVWGDWGNQPISEINLVLIFLQYVLRRIYSLSSTDGT